MNAPNESGFCWIESASGVSGFIRSVEYFSAQSFILLLLVQELNTSFAPLISLFDPVAHSADYVCVRRSVAQVAPASPEIAFSSSALPVELNYACKAVAIKAFHIAIRSTSKCAPFIPCAQHRSYPAYSVSKQKTLLRDLWNFHVESFLHHRSRDIAPCDFSVSLFAAAEDSLMDVLSEAYVLAVSSEAAISAPIIADMMAFLPKDVLFLSLVKLIFASAEQICLPSSSATRHIISALLLHDSHFAATVRSGLVTISVFSYLQFRTGCQHCSVQSHPPITRGQLRPFRRLYSHCLACGNMLARR
jgi:hypothetical protein